MNTYYLNRRILPQLSAALVAGGALLIETPLFDPQIDCPNEIARRVRPGELVRIFSDLDVAHYEEVPRRTPHRTHAVCRMVAFRAPGRDGPTA